MSSAPLPLAVLLRVVAGAGAQVRGVGVVWLFAFEGVGVVGGVGRVVAG